MIPPPEMILLFFFLFIIPEFLLKRNRFFLKLRKNSPDLRKFWPGDRISPLGTSSPLRQSVHCNTHRFY